MCFSRVIITEVESIFLNEYTCLEVNRYFSVDIKNMTIAVMMLVCERNKIKLDAQKIDEFMHQIFLNDKDDQMNKSTIDTQYKQISEKYKDADIE